jgi:hypothetical protein
VAKHFYFKSVRENRRININENYFYAASFHEDFAISKWLYETAIEEGNPYNRYTIAIVFSIVCFRGNLSAMKWLYENEMYSGYPINIHDLDDKFFCEDVCSSNNLSAIIWLYEKSVEIGSPFVINNYGFNNACIRGDLNIMKWLYEKAIAVGSPLTIKTHAFDLTYSYNNVSIVEWLYQKSIETKSRINIHHSNEYPFIISYTRGYVSIIKWIYEKSMMETYSGLIVNNGNKLTPMDILSCLEGVYQQRHMFPDENKLVCNESCDCVCSLFPTKELNPYFPCMKKEIEKRRDIRTYLFFFAKKKLLSTKLFEPNAVAITFSFL